MFVEKCSDVSDVFRISEVSHSNHIYFIVYSPHDLFFIFFCQKGKLGNIVVKIYDIVNAK